MQFATQGLIVRESSVGESDRLVWILTKDEGLLRAFVRKAKEMKSRTAGATQLLCYSELKIYRGKERYIVSEAKPIKVFFELYEDITALSLAQYFCELAGKFAPEGTPAEAYLRLLLNALFYLSRGERPQALLKAAVEMRILALSGFMPDLVACAQCGEYLTDRTYFYPQKGSFLCENCHLPSPEPCYELSRGAISALRHTIYADFEKLFAFSLSPQSEAELAAAAEGYAVSSIGYRMKTLDFYHKILTT